MEWPSISCSSWVLCASSLAVRLTGPNPTCLWHCDTTHRIACPAHSFRPPSKFQPLSALWAAYQEDHRLFDENYVQELLGKCRELPSDVQWHFIGHMQSNKVKALLEGCPNLEAIMSSQDSGASAGLSPVQKLHS